ncbi:RICIN domain-containing protein [Actinosynnema sp. CS-041913]|uniref:RICIN domain-containing protein n=1 Tax=Actinosynnema sp. CS-041913 TaxID=3239917 RepID=UPI003D8F1BDB
MKLGRVAAVLATVMLAMLAVVPSASAAQQWTWQSRGDGGYFLDHNFEQGVHTRPRNGGPHQLWEVKRYSDGTYRFMNVGTKMCLDNSEHGVRGFGCNDGAWQRWRMGDWGNGDWELVSMWNNHCLYSGVHGIRTVGCTGDWTERWR